MKKKIFGLLLIFTLVIGLTGCGSSGDSNNKGDKETNGGATVVDNDYVSIRFVKREYKKIPGMMNNERVVFNLPTVLLNINNKTNEKIHFEVRASKNIGDKIDYYFSLTNENRVIDTTGTVLEKGEIQDVNVIYQKSKDLEKEYPLDIFNDKTIYLRLYKYGSEGQTEFIEEYEIETSKLK